MYLIEKKWLGRRGGGARRAAARRRSKSPDGRSNGLEDTGVGAAPASRRGLAEVVEHLLRGGRVGVVRRQLEEPLEVLLGLRAVAGVRVGETERVVRLGQVGVGLERLLEGLLGARHVAGGRHTLTQLGLVPVWRLRFDQGRSDWFVEAGIGVSVLDKQYQIPGKRFGTEFNFHDTVGVGRSFGTNRADIVGDIHAGGGEITQWFNTAAFAQPALGQFGNSGRSILRGPGINNLDLGFFKNFSLPKDATLQFRVEAFNAFNHPQFQGVSQNITSANFGVVTSARPGRIVQLGAKLLW